MGFWGSSNDKGNTPASKKSLRDGEADAELAELIAELDKEHATGNSNSKKREGRDRGEVDTGNDYSSSFQGEMSCLSAFDEVFYCYSIGGQFLNVYRYGELRDCSEKSRDWRFCMRAKMYGPVTRRAMIMAHNKEKATKYKTGPSSEDIWKIRKVPLENAFTGVPADQEEEKRDAIP